VTLLDKESRDKLEGEVRKIEKIETAVERSFKKSSSLLWQYHINQMIFLFLLRSLISRNLSNKVQLNKREKEEENG
jgi:hypothetical protein